MIGRTAKWVASAHGAVILALMTSSLVKGCEFRRKKPEPLATFVTIETASSFSRPQIQEVAQISVQDSPAPLPEPPKPAAIPEQPKPEPVKPQPEKPKAEPVKPKPEKPKWTPKPVVRQDNKVRNPNTTPTPRTPSPDFAKILENATTKLTGNISAKSNNQLPGEYSQRIQAEMYAAWRQPSVAVNSSHGAIVRIRIEKNGTISSAILESSSGNAQIDSTALTAARSVRLPPLPENIPSSISVTVEFKLTN
jgi:TonB family protein